MANPCDPHCARVPIVRCPDLLGELIEVYVISNDYVPVGVVDEVVVAQHISFSGITRFDNAHGVATLSEQLVQTKTQGEASAGGGRNSGHDVLEATSWWIADQTKPRWPAQQAAASRCAAAQRDGLPGAKPSVASGSYWSGGLSSRYQIEVSVSPICSPTIGRLPSVFAA